MQGIADNRYFGGESNGTNRRCALLSSLWEAALIYAAADVFVAPSVQDNLPNTVMAALACGTPCVAFKIGGMPDLIEHKQNGYLAHPFAIEYLAQGMAWVLESRQRWQVLSSRAREKVEQEFTLEKQARRYLSVFEEVSTTTFKQS
jgi:glycosyltransferase involved in cell wall biosynthesis